MTAFPDQVAPPTDAELLDMVEKMRAKQREYFRTRSLQVLNESKAMEKYVDHWLKIRKQGALL